MDFSSVKRAGGATYSSRKRQRASTPPGAPSSPSTLGSPTPSPAGLAQTSAARERLAAARRDAAAKRRDTSPTAELFSARLAQQRKRRIAASREASLTDTPPRRRSASAARDEGERTPPTPRPQAASSRIAARLSPATPRHSKLAAARPSGSQPVASSPPSSLLSSPPPLPPPSSSQPVPVAAKSAARAGRRRQASVPVVPSTPQRERVGLSAAVAQLFEQLSPGGGASSSQSLLDVPAALQRAASASSGRRKGFAARMAPRRTASGNIESASQPLSGATSSALRPRDEDTTLQAEEHDLADGSPFRTPSPEPQSAHTTPSQGTPRRSAAAKRVLGVSAPTVPNARRTYGEARSFLAEADPAFAEADQGLAAGPAGLSSVGSTPSRRDGWSGKAPGQRESYAELKHRWHDEDDEEEDESAAHLALKSVTNLRSAGEQRRFNDEFEYLISGLDATLSLSVRRNAALEILRQVCGLTGDAEPSAEAAAPTASHTPFLRGLQATGGVARLWRILRAAQAGEGVDEALDAALALLLARVAQSQSMAEPLMRDEGADLWSVVTSMMQAARLDAASRSDGLWRINGGSSKAVPRQEQYALESLSALAAYASVLPAACRSPTVRTLLLSALCSLAVLRPRPDFDPLVFIGSGSHTGEPAPTADAPLLRIVLADLRAEAQRARQRLTAFAKGVELMPLSAAAGAPDLAYVDLGLHLLELSTASGNVSLCADDDIASIAEDLVALLQLLECHVVGGAQDGKMSVHTDSDEDSGLRDRRGGDALVGALKVLLNLSQGHEAWAPALLAVPGALLVVLRLILVPATIVGSLHTATASTSVEASDSGSPHAAFLLDLLALALGLLTNLLEAAPQPARSALSTLELSLSCRRHRCIATCSCERRWRRLALEHLGRLFRAEHDKSAQHDDADAGFLAGCLAVMLALAVVDSPPNLAALRRAFESDAPRSSVSPKKKAAPQPVQVLMPLVTTLDDFAQLNRAVREKARAVLLPDGDDDDDGDGERAKAVDIAVGDEGLVADLARRMRAIVESGA